MTYPWLNRFPFQGVPDFKRMMTGSQQYNDWMGYANNKGGFQEDIPLQPSSSSIIGRQSSPNVKIDPFFALNGVVNGPALLSGITDRGRQNQYMQDQFSTMGQLDAIPVQNFQPNPFSLYAKYGGSLKRHRRRMMDDDDDDWVMETGGLSPNKAREILHDGTAHGHKLTEKQRRFFGAKSKGNTMKYDDGGDIGGPSPHWPLHRFSRGETIPTYQEFGAPQYITGSPLGIRPIPRTMDYHDEQLRDYDGNVFALRSTASPNSSKIVFADADGKPDLSRGQYEIPNDKFDQSKKLGIEQIFSVKDFDKYKKLAKGGKWLQGAVNPEHRGFCTPLSKPTCTGHRRAFALMMKKKHGFHK